MVRVPAMQGQCTRPPLLSPRRGHDTLVKAGAESAARSMRDEHGGLGANLFCLPPAQQQHRGAHTRGVQGTPTAYPRPQTADPWKRTTVVSSALTPAATAPQHHPNPTTARTHPARLSPARREPWTTRECCKRPAAVGGARRKSLVAPRLLQGVCRWWARTSASVRRQQRPGRPPAGDP